MLLLVLINVITFTSSYSSEIDSNITVNKREIIPFISYSSEIDSNITVNKRGDNSF
jgi:hypothetical protein